MNALVALWGADLAAFMVLAAVYGMLAPGEVWKDRVLRVVVILGFAWLFPMMAFIIVFPIVQFLNR
jgi:hypothetical protein